MKLSLALIAALLTGCAAAPHTIRAGLEHVSHPTVGRPFNDTPNSEDWLSHATVTAVWEGDYWYAETGVGYNVGGRNGTGFYGPSLTGIARAGVQVRVRR